MVYIPEALIEEIEELKDLGKFDEAIQLVNKILSRDPSNEDAILQIADIQYRRGEIGKLIKPLIFSMLRKKIMIHFDSISKGF